MLKQHLIQRTLAGGLVIAAIGLPSGAQAMRVEAGGGGSGTAWHGPVQVPGNSYGIRALRPGRSASDASLLRDSQHGSEWGDAGIAAAGAVVVFGAAAVGVGMTRRRRNQRTVVG
jgi:hypothetical protein